MTPLTFTIPGKLPGLNQLFGAANRCRWAGAEMKKKQTKYCAHHILSAGLPKIRKAVTLHFEWIEPDYRRDVDNISTGQKFILDALVECGILPDDRREWVTGISHSFPEPDRTHPRIVVTINQEGKA